MSLEDEAKAGFEEAFDTVRAGSGSEQGGPATLTFGGVAIPAVLGTFGEALVMQNGGYQPDLVEQVVVKMSDFATLSGIENQSEVSVDGRTLRVVRLDREPPFVTISLKAVR